MNSRREEPWRPDWTLQVFDLGGWNTAINMPNGRGKSTIVHAVLAMLGSDKSLGDIRKKHFAPMSTGHYSHVRIETYIRVDDESPVDLVVQGGGDAGGYPMVFGVYGNSGESGTWRVYAYQGTLEDCPIGRRSGNRITLIGNSPFLETLSAMPGCFPATQREATRSNWREYVGGLFDMAGIEQQLVYQKAKGAEGSSGYFDVNPGRRDFSEAVFYERLAPELLVDMMSSFDEYSDERGIEDTIHQKVQGIIKAKVRTARTAEDLEKTRRLLEELKRIQGRAEAVNAAKASANRTLAEFSLQYAALKTVVVDDPVPGIPLAPPEDAPSLARAMVMQRGEWYLPDRAFESFTGEKPSAINQRADRQKIGVEAADKSQVIDFYCDSSVLGRSSGPAAKLYGLDAAAALLAASTNFIGQYTRESAIRAVEEAFTWVKQHGDTNPARTERRKLEQQQAEARAARANLAQKRDALSAESAQLRGEQQRIGEQQGEYRRMVESGLFSELELASPAETGRRVQSEFAAAEGALTTHRDKVRESRQVFNDWQEFTREHGTDADPAEFAAMLEHLRDDAQSALAENTQAITDVKRRTDEARKNSNEKAKARDDRSKQVDELLRLRPLAKAFVARFGDENPDGLPGRVTTELRQAIERQSGIRNRRAEMSEPLAALMAFRARYGEDVAPEIWLKDRGAEREALVGETQELRADLGDLEARRRDLDKAAVAPGKVAREVLSLAGEDALPLHTVIEGLGLPQERKSSVLSLFSALLFSPVYDNAERAAAVARNLAANGIESPVFVAAELAEFCRTADIAWNGSVAKTWLVGVRTRPVDCLLDPSLVPREKQLLDERITTQKDAIEAMQSRIAALDPESEEAVAVRKAGEAVKKGYPDLDATLAKALGTIETELPRLEDRASPDAIAAIRAVVEYRRLLGGKSEEVFEEELARLDELARLAAEQLDRCEEELRRITSARDTLQAALRDASVNATNIPKLKSIERFVSGGGPSFMTAAPEEERKLEVEKDKADIRRTFRFDLAESFVRSGDKRPREIEERLAVIEPERDRITNAQIPEIERQLDRFGEQLPAIFEATAHIDNFVRELRRKYRDMAGTQCAPVNLPPDDLLTHPLLLAAQAIRRSASPMEVASALLDLRQPLDDIDAASLKHRVDAAQRACETAQGQLSTEIDRVKGDPSIGMNEQFRIGLERGKADVGELFRMISAADDSYAKSLAANETARKHLDEEWANIGSWLENFTRRLPGNFETMRSVFKPSRDDVSGEIISAGFDITARIADTNDVRTVLTSIVEKVEKAEKGREALGDDETRRAHYERDMRKEIREEFYRNVILEPRIKVCIPSISRKPLKLEKNMASSGQGVAMTLLWIVKMADYVTERELQMQNVSSAQRKRARRLRTSFVIIDGAFSHLSDKRLITDALDGVKRTRGRFQLIITGHDANYKNDFAYFPSYIVGREIGGNLMYAESETRRLLEPAEVGTHDGVMELASWHKIPESLA
ncbi:hypothetical protein A33K_18724 [Burkholderia humptydooensis MSMB43]|nr:hypothetical protein A33K_18724 [Burkholderia humptydooensis MSMB43]